MRAGRNFALIVHLKNTSKATAVKNMLFDLNAPHGYALRADLKITELKSGVLFDWNRDTGRRLYLST